ncbi:MAG TPA: radical SAM protein [Candidatus Limnocylindrales bacterium]|jgi:wyosine [tRNA(Phe)-imidazoG37] synthetase (radical SAM superfamily)|nr:radical SAM protein [Candidatus Limnocylindrales bacterium]
MDAQDLSGGPLKGIARSVLPPSINDEAAFGYPRDFLSNRFVYLVISPRARGLSVGVNLNPMVRCNFNCLYCEIDRTRPALVNHLDVQIMVNELAHTLRFARAGGLAQIPRYAGLPEELLQVRHIALSGDGEPTLAENFGEAVETIVHWRALGQVPAFKIVLLTNSTGLDRADVRRGLSYMTQHDEIWVKLDAGTQRYLNRINGATLSIEKITQNILDLARERPVIIQSLFPSVDGAEPPSEEIEQYARRLKGLKQNGARISLVQIYSATRPMARSGCGHLPLKALSRIARAVRNIAELPAEVF